MWRMRMRMVWRFEVLDSWSWRWRIEVEIGVGMRMRLFTLKKKEMLKGFRNSHGQRTRIFVSLVP